MKLQVQLLVRQDLFIQLMSFELDFIDFLDFMLHLPDFQALGQLNLQEARRGRRVLPKNNPNVHSMKNTPALRLLL